MSKVLEVLDLFKDLNIESYVLKKDTDMLIITDETNNSSVVLYRNPLDNSVKETFMVINQLTSLY